MRHGLLERQWDSSSKTASRRTRIACAVGWDHSSVASKRKERIMVRGKGRGLYAPALLVALMIGWIGSGNGLVFGQSFSAAISGSVRDTTGAVVPGVKVTAKHTESGLTRSVNTNENGDYRMPSLPVGAYEVTGEILGFK